MQIISGNRINPFSLLISKKTFAFSPGKYLYVYLKNIYLSFRISFKITHFSQNNISAELLHDANNTMLLKMLIYLFLKIKNYYYLITKFYIFFKRP